MPLCDIQEAREKGTTIEIFAYGSLRTNQWLHERIEPHITRKCEAKTGGWLHSYAKGAYPVAFFDSEALDKIVGEVFTVHLHQDIVDLIEMERNAGYVCKWIDVLFSNNTTMKALSFEYSFPDDNNIEEYVPDGDWIAFRSSLDEINTDFLTQTLSDMICADSVLYTSIVHEMVDEVNSPIYGTPEAINDLEQMLNNPKYVRELKNYVRTVQENGASDAN